MDENREGQALKITQTIAGTIIFLVMFYVYIFEKQFPEFLYLFPGLLFGADLSKIIGAKR